MKAINLALAAVIIMIWCVCFNPFQALKFSYYEDNQPCPSSCYYSR